MTQLKTSYRLCQSSKDIGEYIPNCPHGPCLLFERIGTDDTILDKFYACAACRDKRDCNFYLKYGVRDSADKRELRQKIYSQATEKHQRYCYHRLGSDAGVEFCPQCDVISPREQCLDSSHKPLWRMLTKQQFLRPTRWIDAKTKNKSNAQYLFSDDVTDFTVETLKKLSAQHVICIGTPTVHEALIYGECRRDMKSLLLDIDVRLRQFFDGFAHYNMFNHHFFDDGGHEKYEDFISGADTLYVIVDPPYGGLVEALKHTLDSIQRDSNSSVKTLLFFPYYLEKQVTKYLPGVHMSDYKVDYSNHSGYRGGPDGKRRGSPSRLYSDVPLNILELPQSHGYRYCNTCLRYVSQQNQHCHKCNSCTTKDGPTYRHCDKCDRCVKPSQFHCNSCGMCQLQDHRCDTRGDNSQDCRELKKNSRKSKRVSKGRAITQSVDVRPYKKSRK